MILCGEIVILVGKRAKQHQHTAAIDALHRTSRRRHDMAAEPSVGMTWAERLA